MTTLSTAPAYMLALQANLVGRAALTGVGVYTAPVSSAKAEAIVLIDVTERLDWAALGNSRQDEGYDISGVVRVFRTGAGETVAVAARARAFALLTELMDECRTDPTQSVASVFYSHVSQAKLRQGIYEGKRAAVVEFVLSVRSRVSTV